MFLAVEDGEVVWRGSGVLDSVGEELNKLSGEVGSIVLGEDEISGGGVNPCPCEVVCAGEEVIGLVGSEEWINGNSNEDVWVGLSEPSVVSDHGGGILGGCCVGALSLILNQGTIDVRCCHFNWSVQI